jgi:methyl-accepting chemotaxis protein
MSRPTDESRTSAARAFIAKLSLRSKLYLVFGVALIAVVAPSVLLPFVGRSDDRALAHLEDVLVPEADAALDLQRALERVNEGVQLAAASADPGALRAVEATRHEAAEHLTVLEEADTPVTPTLARAVKEYVTAAQRAIEHALAGSAQSSELTAALAAYTRLEPRVTREVEARRDAVRAGFDEASMKRERGRPLAFAAASILLLAFFAALRLVVMPTETQLRNVREAFERFARGDFATEVPVLSDDELGVLARAVNSTAKRLGALVVGLRSTAAQLNTAAAEMSATSNQHQRGASEQSSAVEETQRTMQSMLASMDQINGSIDSVLANAEQTQEKNQLIAESIVTLSTQADGITEVLATIKDIANKAELLALNAALEGTKAGEIGRGFSLVATQMQRLAENVQRAVADIKQLTESIRRASTASVLATEEGTKLATDTTRSAREIRFVMQQHQTATRQVTAAMDDVASVAQQTAASSREILTSSQDLAQLSERLLDTTSRLGSDVTEGHVEGV